MAPDRFIILNAMRPDALRLLFEPAFEVSFDGDSRRGDLLSRSEKPGLVALGKMLQIIEGLIFDLGRDD